MQNPRVANTANADALQRPVWAIRLIGSVARGATDDEYYHWRYYLCTFKDNQVRAVTFDMSPRDNRDPTGKLHVAASEQVVSLARDHVLFDVDPLPKLGITPQMFLDAYMRANLHLFRFTEQGRGCLTHNVRVMQVMEDVGLAVSGGTKALQKWLKTQAETNRRIEKTLAEGSKGTYDTKP